VALTVVGEGKPVLFLHSSMSSQRQWQPLVVDLREDHCCIVPDLQGYGVPASIIAGSFAGREYQMADEAAALVPLLAELNITEPLTIIGHSFGGALALHLAMTQPFAIANLVLFEPVAFHLLKNNPSSECAGLLAEVQALADHLLELGNQDAARVFIDYWQAPGYFATLPKRMQHTLALQVGKVTLDFQALIGEPLQLQDYQRLTLPTQLLTGEQSRRSAQKISELLHTTIIGSELRSVVTGHMGPVTHPALVNAEIIRFLRRGLD
jgi:pimeloyl-ACP methyl ester carboxylesterase